MKVKILTFQLSVARWLDNGGGVKKELVEKAEKELNETLKELSKKHFAKIEKIDVKNFTLQSHNNGGANEIWVQYTIFYYD